MAITHRAIRIEREENITALLLDIVSAVEVLALLTCDADDQARLGAILDLVTQLKYEAIERRNSH